MYEVINKAVGEFKLPKSVKQGREDRLYNLAKQVKDCIDSGEYIVNSSSWKDMQQKLGIINYDESKCFEKNWTEYKAKTKYYGLDGIITEVTLLGYVNSITLYKSK